MNNQELVVKALDTLSEAFEQGETTKVLEHISNAATSDPTLPDALESLYNILSLIIVHVSLALFLKLQESDAPTPS